MVSSTLKAGLPGDISSREASFWRRAFWVAEFSGTGRPAKARIGVRIGSDHDGRCSGTFRPRAGFLLEMWRLPIVKIACLARLVALR
jgi:hypothetical protein